MEKVKRKKWTDDETRRLIALSEKYTKSEIAKKLHRTPSSVGCKLQCLGVTGGLSGRTEKWNFRQIEEELGHLDTLIYALSSSFSEDMEECREHDDEFRTNRKLRVYKAVISEVLLHCIKVDNLMEEAIKKD